MTIENTEVPLKHGEYLYSRTDGRSVILSGNAVFFRVSGYSADQALGAPHKLVRHELMPRGTFHLMWQTLKAGEPFCAFVRNQTGEGRYYWVCSLVTPCEGGYLSVRKRPSGPHFDLARETYSEMLAAEAAGASPAASAEILVAGLIAAGFTSLKDFMADALAHHAVDLSRSDCPVGQLRTLRADLAKLAGARAELLATLQKLYLIPTNMRILASRLEPSGGPVSAISDSYKRAASELMVRLHRGADSQKAELGVAETRRKAPIGGLDGGDLMSDALFLLSASTIMSAAEAQFRTEPGIPQIDNDAERALLSALVSDFADRSHRRSAEVAANIVRIGKEAEHIKRLMAGLDQIRILGEVESGRIRHADGGLSSIMAQLTSFHGLIHTRLSAMSNAAARMHVETA